LAGFETTTSCHPLPDSVVVMMSKAGVQSVLVPWKGSKGVVRASKEIVVRVAVNADVKVLVDVGSIVIVLC
jgi:hypothetical protein